MRRNFLDILERRFGAWTIPQFPLFIVAANATIYILGMSRIEFLYRLILDTDAVRMGEWWRVVTFLFVPPMMAPITMLFWLYLLYIYARALESEWGSFRFCLYYAVGAVSLLFTAFFVAGENLSNVPLNTTLFLAFAALFPDYELLLFFILPVRVKYLAWVVWAGLLYSFVIGTSATRWAIAASFVNYVLFVGPAHLENWKLRWQVFRNRRRFPPFRTF